MTSAAVALERPRPSAAHRLVAFVRRNALNVFALLALGYLFLPIAIVILFSFNAPAGRFNYTWQGFTLDNWTDPFGFPGVKESVELSLEIAALSSIFATVLGTLIALALVRYGFRGRGLVNLLIFVPMATPEIVMGGSLLTLFVNWRIPQGFLTILIAHVMFNISYVVVTVRARMQGFDRRLEEAAMDLGANEWQTFWRVTFPLIFPGILAAALLAFSLSIDDFIITQFTSGTDNTYPIWVWSSIRNRLPPQVHVLGTIIFVAAVSLVVFSTLWQRRRERATLRSSRA
jgi:spermidine/putrescine transport system permease protein